MPEQFLAQIKLKIRYLLSILLFIITLIGTIMNKYGVIDLDSVQSLDPEYELNITNFRISKNEICKNYITEESISIYISHINKYQVSKSLNNKINYCEPFIAISLIIFIYYIVKQNDNVNENYIKIINFSFYDCFFLLIIQYFSILLYIIMYIKVIKIFSFIETNVKNRCIIMLKANYIIKCLKQKIKIIIVLACYNLCCVILIIYLLKMLFILNNFFNQNKTDINQELENKSREMSILIRTDIQHSFVKI